MSSSARWTSNRLRDGLDQRVRLADRQRSLPGSIRQVGTFDQIHREIGGEWGVRRPKEADSLESRKETPKDSADNRPPIRLQRGWFRSGDTPGREETFRRTWWQGSE